MFNIKKVRDGVILSVKVKPNSPKFFIESNSNIIIHCKSSPKQNKANIEIIKELERLFKTRVEIISGLTSKKKSILIHNITKQEVKKMIECKS